MDERIKRLEFTSWGLKWIALLTMLIDHIGAVLYPEVIVFRIIGRISFPIFCFLIVEGFVHTHDLRKYIGRMLVFALISEIPFDYAFSGVWIDMSHQNVMFTFCLSLMLLAFLREDNGTVTKIIVSVLVVIAAYALCTDYAGFGVLTVLIFLYFHDNKAKKFLVVLCANLGCGSLQAFAGLSIPFLALYNGREGRKMKYFFYVFYPGHLLILGLLRDYLIR